MRRLIMILLVGVLLTAVFVAQDDTAKGDITPTIRVNSRMVVVDAVITDAAGKPVTDLKPDDITIEENGKAQKIASVELVNAPQQPPDILPETIYSNRPEFLGPRGGYTILLIDALNTPVDNQAYARQQLLRYVASQLQPGHRIAVYALANSLYKLQGFTDDPEQLKAAIIKAEQLQLAAPDTKATPPAASNRAPLSMTLTGTGASPTMQSITSRINAFTSERYSYNEQIAIGTTTGALRTLARMMLGIPGRKNLVWVSAGVPITMDVGEMTTTTVLAERPAGDPTAPPPLQREMSYDAYQQNVRQQAADDVKETASLVQQAQISIYPVDARGLFGGTSQTTATTSGLNAAGLLVMGNEYGRSVAASGKAISDSQANMKTIATQTGGRYFVNRNDIDVAVATASNDGGVYYTVAYYPEKKKFDGSFRRIKISVKRPGLTVRNRNGYYAFDFSKGSKKDKDNTLTAAVNQAWLAPSTMLMFDARITPPEPAAKATVPILFRVPAGNFTIGDSKKLDLDFFVTAATPDGKVAASTGSTVNMAVNNEQYQQIQKMGVLLNLDVALAPGRYNVVLAVRDNPTGMIGTLNVPLELKAPGK